jgi:transposase-like protein
MSAGRQGQLMQFDRAEMIQALRSVVQRLHYPLEVMLVWCDLVEQDHRAVKGVTRPMPGFKTIRCARILIAGIEVMHMILFSSVAQAQSA